MFESLDENKKPNIGKLRYENPKKKEAGYVDLVKNFAEKLTDEDWLAIEREIDEEFKKSEVSWFSLHDYLLAAAQIASIEKFNKLNIDREGCWQAALKLVRKCVDQGRFIIGIDLAGQMKILAPERSAELKKILPLEKILSTLNSSKQFWTLAMAKVIYPEAISKLGLEPALREAQGEIRQHKQDKTWFQLGFDMAYFKILFPKESPPISLDREFWQGMTEGEEMRELYSREYLTKYGYLNLLRHNLHLKLIAAKEIKITDTSFEVIMPPEASELKEDIPKPPVIRKF